MDLVLEINEKVKRLDEDSQKLVLGVISRFLNENDDFLSEEDLKDIDVAGKERLNGETYSFSDIEAGLV